MQPSTASVGGRHTCFTEPENAIFMYPLQPPTGETLRYITPNYEDGARVDVSASGLRGGKHQKVFLMSNCLIRMYLYIIHGTSILTLSTS